MELVEEAKELYLRKAQPQTSGGHERDKISTTQDPQPSMSDSGSEEDDAGSIHESRNGLETRQTGSEVMSTPWKIFFQEQTINSTSNLTNQTAGSTTMSQIPHDIAGKSTNHRTGEDSACDKDGSELHTNGSSCAHSSACALTGQKDSCTQDSAELIHHHCKGDDIGESAKQSSSKTFLWNVNATEFVPT